MEKKITELDVQGKRELRDPEKEVDWAEAVCICQEIVDLVEHLNQITTEGIQRKKDENQRNNRS